MIPDEIFMRRAFELAQFGLGKVSPNPVVGCVIVRDGNIIGEGWHKKYGEAHAEVNAINSVENKSLLQGSTVYVSLEPCSHFGKTPPCADTLVEHKVGRVVISNFDTNPLVAGGGVEKLKAAGIEVVTGVLESEGRELNKRFFKVHEKNRPYIILKWAQTQDGFIARKNYESRWISNELSRTLVHKWRTEEDAVLVGTKTAAHDNPQLTARNWSGRNPKRLVIDRFLRLPDSLYLLDQSVETYCFNVLKHEEQTNLKLIRLSENNFIPDLVDYLYRSKIQSVIVEGGAQTLKFFIDLGLWDEARIFKCTSRYFNEGILAPVPKGTLIGEEFLDEDLLQIIKN